MNVLISLFAINPVEQRDWDRWFRPITNPGTVRAHRRIGPHRTSQRNRGCCRLCYPPVSRTLFTNGIRGFLLLGSIILAVTGAEALYADMGHFGAGPIRSPGSASSCLRFVLALPRSNVVPQRAWAVENPLYLAGAETNLWPWCFFVFATTGDDHHRVAGVDHRVFSLTRQAIGVAPRVTIRHTSGQTTGRSASL